MCVLVCMDVLVCGQGLAILSILAIQHRNLVLAEHKEHCLEQSAERVSTEGQCAVQVLN